MNQTEVFKLKNERRKAGKLSAGSNYGKARYKRQRGFIGKDGMCTNGAFGRVAPGSYNELAVGTSASPKGLTADDLYDNVEP